MHLYGENVERYVSRDLPPAALASIDTHISNCLFCAHALADATVASTTWERRGWLGRLARVERPAPADAAGELRSRAA